MLDKNVLEEAFTKLIFEDKIGGGTKDAFNLRLQSYWDLIKQKTPKWQG